MKTLHVWVVHDGVHTESCSMHDTNDKDALMTLAEAKDAFWELHKLAGWAMTKSKARYFVGEIDVEPKKVVAPLVVANVRCEAAK